MSGSLLYGPGHLLESSQFFLALSQANNIKDLNRVYSNLRNAILFRLNT